jgi:hypothetical protein
MQPSTSNPTITRGNSRESPKRIIGNKQQKTKPSPDEWVRKLEAESAGYNDEDEDEAGASSFQRGTSGRRRSAKKKKPANGDNIPGIFKSHRF